MSPDPEVLANAAKQRFDGRNPLTAAKKTLVLITRGSAQQLTALSREVSKIVGFRVWPNQIAALLIERGLK